MTLNFMTEVGILRSVEWSCPHQGSGWTRNFYDPLRTKEELRHQSVKLVWSNGEKEWEANQLRKSLSKLCTQTF